MKEQNKNHKHLTTISVMDRR